MNRIQATLDGKTYTYAGKRTPTYATFARKHGTEEWLHLGWSTAGTEKGALSAARSNQGGYKGADYHVVKVA